MSRSIALTAIVAFLLAPRAPSGAGTVQWDFNGDLTSSTGGLDLVPGAASPAASPGVDFTVEEIGGADAEVASFTRGTFFQLTHGSPPNGGGLRLNQYTLILDVLFPDRAPSGGWAALWQTGVANRDDGDWFVNPGAGVGISGQYGGLVEDGVWHRLALVVDSSKTSFVSFVDGVQVQEVHEAGKDGRFSLDAAALLFADESGENAAGFVNSVQLRDAAMTADDLLALGGPAAEGIPLAADPRDCVFRNFSAGYDPAANIVAGTWAGLPGDEGFRVFEGARQIGGDLPASARSFTDAGPPAAGAAVKYTLEALVGGQVERRCDSSEIQTFSCPSDLTASVDPSTRFVTLTWRPAANAGFSGYELGRNGRILATFGPADGTFEDRGILKGGTYLYRLSPIGLGAAPCPEPALRARAVVPGDDALLFEDFDRRSTDGDLAAAGWEVHEEGQPLEDAAWTVMNPGGRGNPPGAGGIPSSGKFLVSDSDFAAGKDQAGTGVSHDIWSPSIDASGRGTVWLHLDCSAMLNNNGDAVFAVDVSTDGGSTWENVFHRVSPGRGLDPLPAADIPEWAPGGPQEGNADGLYGPLDLDLSGVAGSRADFRLRLRHYEPTDDWWIAVDNVLVDSTPALGGIEEIVVEGFDAGIPAGWGVTSEVNGTAMWDAADPCNVSLFHASGGVFPDGFDGQGLHHLGDTFALAAADPASCTAVPQDEWLKTPVLDFSSARKVFLGFRSDLLVTDAVAEVLLSLDGGASFDAGDPLFSYNAEDRSLVRYAGDPEPVYDQLLLEVPLAQEEKSVAFAFHYLNPLAGTGYWAIDDITVSLERKPSRPSFHRGDADGLGDLDITDAVYLLGYLYLAGPVPPCLEAANVNNDEALDITDAINLLGFLYLGGPPPADPGPIGRPCGEDPDFPGTPGDLGCAGYSNCR